MSLYSLHPIELQMIAQFLPVREILSFARRCRFTLAALDSPFAFQCDPLKFETKNSLPGAFSADRRLLRHVQVSLVWSRPPSRGVSHICLASDVDALLAIASKVARVVALDATPWPAVSCALSERVLPSPSMTHLRELRLHPGMVLSPACMKAVGALSQLRRLQLAVARSDPLTEIGQLPRLTHLGLWFFFDAYTLPCLSGFASLQSLHLDDPAFHGHSWLPFWSAVPRLVSVSIAWWDCDPSHWTAEEPAISNEDFAVAFRSLKRMTSFTLANTMGVNRMLGQLHHAPALSRVHLNVRCEDSDTGDQGNCFPSPAVVRSLLAAVPALTISLMIETARSRLSDRRRAEEWQSLYNDQRAEFGQRLQVELTVNQS